MNSRPSLVCLLLFFCLASVLPAWGRKEEKGTVIQATGLVRLVGSSPVTDVVITGTDKEWYIAKEEEYKLRALQQQIVTVEGTETVENLTFASGIPAGERRTLSKIKILSKS